MIVRAIPWLLDQGRKPSCVGHAFAAGVNSVIAHRAGIPTSNRRTPPPGVWCSGVSIWRDARWRQTKRYDDVTRGTRLQYAVDSLVERGWDDWEPGEETDAVEASQQDDLRDEMLAYDKRSGKDATRYRIWRRGAERLDQVDAALADPTLVIVGAFYLRDAFFRAQFQQDEQPMPADVFGGGKNSHALLCQGRRVVNGRRQLLLQNSWRKWGGCYLPDGMRLDQCVWVDETAVADTSRCHDLMVVRVTT